MLNIKLENKKKLKKKMAAVVVLVEQQLGQLKISSIYDLVSVQEITEEKIQAILGDIVAENAITTELSNFIQKKLLPWIQRAHQQEQAELAYNLSDFYLTIFRTVLDFLNAETQNHLLFILPYETDKNRMYLWGNANALFDVYFQHVSTWLFIPQEEEKQGRLQLRLDAEAFTRYSHNMGEVYSRLIEFHPGFSKSITVVNKVWTAIIESVVYRLGIPFLTNVPTGDRFWYMLFSYFIDTAWTHLFSNVTPASLQFYLPQFVIDDDFKIEAIFVRLSSIINVLTREEAGNVKAAADIRLDLIQEAKDLIDIDIYTLDYQRFLSRQLQSTPVSVQMRFATEHLFPPWLLLAAHGQVRKNEIDHPLNILLAGIQDWYIKVAIPYWLNPNETLVDEKQISTNIQAWQQYAFPITEYLFRSGYWWITTNDITENTLFDWLDNIYEYVSWDNASWDLLYSNILKLASEFARYDAKFINWVMVEDWFTQHFPGLFPFYMRDTTQTIDRARLTQALRTRLLVRQRFRLPLPKRQLQQPHQELTARERLRLLRQQLSTEEQAEQKLPLPLINVAQIRERRTAYLKNCRAFTARCTNPKNLLETSWCNINPAFRVGPIAAGDNKWCYDLRELITNFASDVIPEPNSGRPGRRPRWPLSQIELPDSVLRGIIAKAEQAQIYIPLTLRAYILGLDQVARGLAINPFTAVYEELNRQQEAIVQDVQAQYNAFEEEEEEKQEQVGLPEEEYSAADQARLQEGIERAREGLQRLADEAEREEEEIEAENTLMQNRASQSYRHNQLSRY
jgi:hypothetical protein